MARTDAGSRTDAVSRTTAVRQDINQNIILNANFEIAPAFVAATSTSNRWIDGTAAGSNALSSRYRWASSVNATQFVAQFDTATVHGGTYSMKLSTLDTTGRGTVR